MGIESMPVKFIRIASESLSPFLAKVFNECLISGYFPSKLKIAKITPIHKSGSTCKATNYRPISFLSPFLKILEKIIYTRLNRFFVPQDTLTKEQFGFRPKHSTGHVISDVIN